MTFKKILCLYSVVVISANMAFAIRSVLFDSFKNSKNTSKHSQISNLTTTKGESLKKH